MITTTTVTLHDLFVAAIVGITPHISYKGSQAWVPYDRPVNSAGRSRRFRIAWTTGSLFPEGIWTNGAVETLCTAKVRTDYVGDVAEMQHAIIEDHFQLRETLCALKSSSNGLIFVESLGVEENAETNEDVRIVDHMFEVRYLRSRV